jgi:hypothetical protein
LDIPSPEFLPTDCRLEELIPVTETDLRRIISSSNLKSCELDPLPPFVIVNVLDDIIAFLVYMFNRSLSDGCLPLSQKRAVVFPVLKKSNLDPNVCQNYRPISNLSFLSKTLERIVAAQLVPYLENSGLLPPTQSGFRSFHSTETLLLSLLSDIYSAMDKSHLSLLALFDVSAAFDMVDHDLLLQRLSISFGLSGGSLKWFRSYLSGRTQMVVLGDNRTQWVSVDLGVPQGSVLGPILYILFTADITSVLAKHSSTGHLYADDIQALVHGPSTDQVLLVTRIQSLCIDLHDWMLSNRLCLNPSKTQLIWFGTRQQLAKLNLLELTSLFPTFTFTSCVRNLGVLLDSALTFSDHISHLTRSCYFQLRRLRAIRRSVSTPIFTSLVHAFISSRVDYCNSLLLGLPQSTLFPLQSVLNAAARLIARLPRFSHISGFMTHDLHWLPLDARLRFKTLLIVTKSQLNLAPKYLSVLFAKPISASSSRPLRSADRLDLHVPRTRISLTQHRAFAIVGPSLWNDLPPTLRAVLLTGINPTSLRSLKTHLFSLLPR